MMKFEVLLLLLQLQAAAQLLLSMAVPAHAYGNSRT
jgi:hypothetical protein